MAVRATPVSPSSKAEAKQAVVDTLPVWHGKKAQVIDYLDLSHPFATTVPWVLVIAQAAGPIPAPEWTDHGPIAVCFAVKTRPANPQCTGAYWQRGEGMAWFVQPYGVVAARVVYAGPKQTRPLLLVQTCSVPGMNGSCSTRTSLYEYSDQIEAFSRVFVHDSDGSNNNQSARFVEHGPLIGDVIVDYPTSHAPYVYWVEVYAAGESGQFARILKYRSHTRYGDGNPLPVIDSEMPAIMERLGVWRPGNALPVPLNMPSGCGQLVLRHAEEWCENLCRPLPGSDCSRYARSEAARDR